MGDDATERSTERNLDGTTTEYFDVPKAEETYRELVRALFEDHWDAIDFGPCLQGAVFELRFASKPRVGYLDGYFTIGPDEPGAWHFHLCVGAHKGTKARPTAPELARWRQCARAAFYRDLDASGRPRSWGLRLWNGRNEQMMTVFFPNPWLNPERTKPVKEPDWSRLALWMDLRARFAGVPPEPAPVDDARRPQMCG
ncbi:hypothetical protein BE21_48250 [Sorangium cellulosum]|uniref:Uncharacterized protein n=1 Tax=Sorangium cellulosum TaxID=56 RepID=A0A150THX9_SORCE|nr:hypothetical protein BE21_48250 [Sorangium cellulosum]